MSDTVNIDATETYDLISDFYHRDDLVAKVRYSDAYAQNLYAALCNMQWQRTEVWPLLKGQLWSVSWRVAGGYIADIRNEGDYLNWYCSGIGPENESYVSEGTVTDEIAADLKSLGWIPVPYED